MSGEHDEAEQEAEYQRNCKLQEVRDLFDGLEQIKQWLLQNEDILASGDIDRLTIGDVILWCDTKEQFVATSRRLGKFKKSANDAYFDHNRSFNGIRVQATIEREKVCTKVVTKKVVAAHPEITIPATPEREVEVVNYECPGSIFAEEST